MRCFNFCSFRGETWPCVDDDVGKSLIFPSVQHLVDCEKLLKSDLNCSLFLLWQGLIFVWKQGCERLFISLFPPLLLQREAPPAGGSSVSWVECSPCGRSSFSSTSSSSHLHRSTSLITLLPPSSPPFHHFPLLRRSLPPLPSSRRPSPSPSSSHLPIISPPFSSAGCLLSSSTPSTTSSPRRHNFLTTSCTSFLYLLSRSPALCVYWRTSNFFLPSIFCHTVTWQVFSGTDLHKAWRWNTTAWWLCFSCAILCSTFRQNYWLCWWLFSIWCLWQSKGLSIISAWRSSRARLCCFKVNIPVHPHMWKRKLVFSHMHSKAK